MVLAGPLMGLHDRLASFIARLDAVQPMNPDTLCQPNNAGQSYAMTNNWSGPAGESANCCLLCHCNQRCVFVCQHPCSIIQPTVHTDACLALTHKVHFKRRKL